VKLSASQDGVAVIASGIEAGETVVTDGQMSLAPGVKVSVHGAATAKAGPAKRARP
jgi:hypothetical protein